MTKTLRVGDYLGHILKAIDRINRYTADLDEVRFLDSELVQDAVIRNIEIIGEASNNIQRVAPDADTIRDRLVAAEQTRDSGPLPGPASVETSH